MSEIKKIKLVNVHIDVSRNIAKKFPLKVECQAKIGTPEKDDDKTALLRMRLNIEIPESDELKILLEADALFEFSERPDDYDKVAKQECIPKAQTEIFRMLDNILVDMGYRKLELKDKLQL